MSCFCVTKSDKLLNGIVIVVLSNHTLCLWVTPRKATVETFEIRSYNGEQKDRQAVCTTVKNYLTLAIFQVDFSVE